MNIISRDQLKCEVLPGRVIQKAVGKDSFSTSSRMTMGFAHYSEESGAMDPHQHAEEIVYIVDSKDSWVRFGESPSNLREPVTLTKGMTLHIPPLEWHVFEYANKGFVDIIFFYGQVDQIRPEEIKK
jgi:hypothetical protein